jgi:dihydroorotate dehydrogenase (fumarate)
MADLATKYMGLRLRNPVVVGSSGLTATPDRVAECESAGAGAVVLKSIFEEQIEMETDSMAAENAWYTEAADYIGSYGRARAVEEYLQLIRDCRERVDIPVIASLHCASPGTWTEFAAKAQEAGAHGLELNMFVLPTNPKRTSEEYERVYTDLLRRVRSEVSMPVSLKVGSFFSSMARTLMGLARTGADGLVLFNRFYRMDIDPEQMKLVPGPYRSHPDETLVPLRWISILSRDIEADLCASTGVHDHGAVAKHLLAGARAVQVCSVLYEKGVEEIGRILEGLEAWMDRRGLDRISSFRGRLARGAEKQTAGWERVQFMRYSADQ